MPAGFSALASQLRSFAIGTVLLSFAYQAFAADKSAPSTAHTWSPAAAAHYLDQREQWWQSWDRAQKDHETYCVSCHTQVPFALARPALRRELGEQEPTAGEQAMLASIQKRVRLWNEVLPFYSDALYGAGKEVESRNAEAVLNAVILGGYDRRENHLTEITRTAFDHAWVLQSGTGPDAGAWVWQNFDYTPWESKESQYYWATQFAIAVAREPVTYRRDPKITAKLALLTGYLRSHYDSQPLLNKIVALSASALYPDLLTTHQRKVLLGLLYALQRSDGGWSLTALGTWKRRDKTPEKTRSDGFATGLMVLVLEETEANGRGKLRIARGIEWLCANQDKATGAWTAWSLNKNRDPQSNVGQFMNDAATGYAVLALEEEKR